MRCVARRCAERRSAGRNGPRRLRSRRRQYGWLEPSCHRFIFMQCSSSDQLSGRGKIPDLAGRSIFYGRMAKRKSSRALLRNMTRLSGLLTMSTLRRGRRIRMTIHPQRPRDPKWRSSATGEGRACDRRRRLGLAVPITCGQARDDITSAGREAPWRL